MRRILDYVDTYLRDYVVAPTLPEHSANLPGGALGLQGDHGSGKTFLLAWLQSNIEEKRKIRCKVAYAKANSPSFIDLYRQVIGSFTREDMLEIVRRAITMIAAQMTGAALATSPASRRLRDYARSLGGGVSTSTPRVGDAPVETIVQSKEVDLNEVYLTLKHQIVMTGSAPALAANIAEVIGLSEDPELGKSAFAWLGGVSPDALDARLPLVAPLFQSGADDRANSPEAVVNALECIATLCRISETPLILLIDQLENFVSPEPASTWSSAFKKLAEQTGRQWALTVLAGTRVTWERLPQMLARGC